MFEPYNFVARNGESVGAELGRLRVPENRRKSDSRRLELAFVRFKGASSARGCPTVYLAGGPGESGIDVARGRHFPLFMALREAGDVIAFDQRGTGGAAPSMACSAWEYPRNRPAEWDQLLHLGMVQARRCAAKLRAHGVDLDGYNTVESAHDVAALADALGVEKVNLWGASYGTHLAFAVMRYHYDRVHRVVLGGVEGPDHTYKLPSTMDRFLMQAGVEPDTVTRVFAALDRKPVTVTVGKDTVVVGSFDVQWITAAGLADTRILDVLPIWYQKMTGGDHSMFQSVPLLGRYLMHLRRGLGTSATAMCMDCASGASPERLRRIMAEGDSAVLGRAVDFPFPEIREIWAVPDLGEAFRAPLHTEIPTLFLSGTVDCRTPASNVDEIKAGFSNHEHVVVNGAGHTDVFMAAPTVTDRICNFFTM